MTEIIGSPAALSPVKVGMLTFLLSEAAFFGTLIMTYVYFLRQTTHGDPNPSQVFRLPMVLAASACLFSSSATIHLAEQALRRDSRQAFLGWWGLTIVLGVLFLVGTMFEWSDLIGKWGLTISRNLFGTTYFTLVGFHALHVTIGVIVDEHRVRPGVAPADHGAEHDRRGSRLLVLALCGWRLGGGFYSGVFGGTLSRIGNRSDDESPINAPGNEKHDEHHRQLLGHGMIRPVRRAVEMPRATAWPIVLALGITLLGAGLVTSLALSSSVRCCSSSAWAAGSANCCPGAATCTSHWSSRRCVPAGRRRPGTVDQLRPGMAGYRFQLPEKIHPISAGVKGGIVGGLVMPIPALAYGLLSGHGLWFPINLLAGMVVPGISGETAAAARAVLRGARSILAIFIHATFSVTFGLSSGSSRRPCRRSRAAP